MERQRILVVEDQDQLREFEAEILVQDGHDVDTACDGVEALALLDRHAYTLIVSDLAMPELDGPSLYREVERRWPQARRRLIFVTANTESDAYEDFLRQTAVPVLAKPFKLADLRNLLAQVLATADTLIAPPSLPATGGLT